MSNNTSTHKDLLVSALGVGSTLIVAGILGFIEVKFGWALYSYMFFFIIPVGAGMAGFVAASGYYLGAKLTHQKPAGGVLLNMIGASISTYFLINYIPYYLIEIDGVRVQEFMSFWKYLDVVISNTSLSFGIRGHDVGATGELGATWGYAYAALQLVGFAAGGLVVFTFLSDNPYCDKCSKYLKKMDTQARYTSEGEKLTSDILDFAELLLAKNNQEGIKYHANFMGDDNFKSHHLCSTIAIYECPSCKINLLQFVASRLKGREWTDIDETKVTQWTNEKLSVN